MGGVKDKLGTMRITLLVLLFAGSVFALVGCGGGGGGGGGGETTAQETTGGETTSARTTTARTTTGGETTAARGGTTTTQVATTNLTLTPIGVSGVSGNANITDAPGGVVVAVNVQGLLTQPGTEHIAHIHEGATCAEESAGNGGPVLYPLNSFIAGPDGTASSVSTLEGVSLEQLRAGSPKYVNVHAEPVGDGSVPPSIACADIPESGGGESTTGGRGGGVTTPSG